MARHKVAELEGALLDAAVAKCEGVSRFYTGDCFVCRPSVDWECGGPIIERERINNDGNLAAAMRAYVASKCGEWIELPE